MATINMRTHYHRRECITLCDILPTGELAPKASITYAGEYEIKNSPEDERTRFLLEMSQPPHKHAEIKRIFGNANNNKDSVEAQKAMYEKFAEIFEVKFRAILQNPAAQNTSNDAPAEPIYFYQSEKADSTLSGGDIMKRRYDPGSPSPMTKIDVFCGETRKLCEVYVDNGDEEAGIKAVQETIMSISKKASLDLNDIFKKPRRDGGLMGGTEPS